MKKVVLITGVAGGIGSATAKVFSNAGWYTIGVDLLEPKNNNFIDRYEETDISDPEAIKNVFINIRNGEGRLDALINNAAVQLVKPLVETAPDEWDQVMGVNVRAAYLAIKYAYPLMQKSGGSIVNVSSVHAVATSKNMSAYVTSKGALTALTRAAALELAKDNIRVNAILPGAVDTKMLRAGLSRNHVKGKSVTDRLAMLGSKHPLGRVGRPEEIGEMILFLSDTSRSAFMTGQTIIADGGATARLSTE